MIHTPTTSQPDMIRRAIHRLQHAPRVRGALYLGTTVIVFQRVGKLQPRDREHDLVRFHLTLLPCTAVVTRACAKLREADRAAWVRPIGGRAGVPGRGRAG